MNAIALTASYEAWAAGFAPPYRPDLDHKHELMADPRDPFPFFRGTYYLWASRWPRMCADLADAPPVLAVGDAHVENFGTWRDIDGRLCWGVNDFDEADELPYTHDLVRLATSARIARRGGGLDVGTEAASRAILSGYRACLRRGGHPFVLEERNRHLRRLATQADREPKPFWRRLREQLEPLTVPPPQPAVAELIRVLPPDCPLLPVRRRVRAGVGSLGRPRFVAVGKWRGGRVAREAKAALPPATAWVANDNRPSLMAEAVDEAVRSPDPFYRTGPAWVVRRLAPRCSRIELDHLQRADVGRVLRAMGAEIANVHLGTPGAADRILADLDDRPSQWLATAARETARVMEADWQAWRTGMMKDAPRGTHE